MTISAWIWHTVIKQWVQSSSSSLNQQQFQHLRYNYNIASCHINPVLWVEMVMLHWIWSNLAEEIFLHKMIQATTGADVKPLYAFPHTVIYPGKRLSTLGSFQWHVSTVGDWDECFSILDTLPTNSATSNTNFTFSAISYLESEVTFMTSHQRAAPAVTVCWISVPKPDRFL